MRPVREVAERSGPAWLGARRAAEADHEIADAQPPLDAVIAAIPENRREPVRFLWWPSSGRAVTILSRSGIECSRSTAPSAVHPSEARKWLAQPVAAVLRELYESLASCKNFLDQLGRGRST